MPTVDDLLHRKRPNLVTITPDHTVIDAIRAMVGQDVGAAVVLDDDGLVTGIFTERDVLRRVVAKLAPPETTPVRDVMTSPVACCKLSTTLEECRRVVALERMRHLPVVEDRKFVGMVTMRDVLARQMQIEQTTVQYLHEYLHGKT